MTVLQSAAGALAGAFSAVADLAAAVFGLSGHTPVMVSTAAVAGTEADVSGGAAGACGPSVAAGPGCAGEGWRGGGTLGAACPQARVPNRTHSSQLLRIGRILQDWSTRKVKMPSRKS